MHLVLLCFICPFLAPSAAHAALSSPTPPLQRIEDDFSALTHDLERLAELEQFSFAHVDQSQEQPEPQQQQQLLLHAEVPAQAANLQEGIQQQPAHLQQQLQSGDTDTSSDQAANSDHNTRLSQQASDSSSSSSSTDSNDDANDDSSGSNNNQDADNAQQGSQVEA